jgi:hypothetical protein
MLGASHIPFRYMHYTRRFLTYRIFVTNTITKQFSDIKLAGHYPLPSIRNVYRPIPVEQHAPIIHAGPAPVNNSPEGETMNEQQRLAASRAYTDQMWASSTETLNTLIAETRHALTHADPSDLWAVMFVNAHKDITSDGNRASVVAALTVTAVLKLAQTT